MDRWTDSTPVSDPAGPDAQVHGRVFFSEGVLHGTRIATDDGWRVVEGIGPGDRVLTFDAGLCVVREVRRACVDIHPDDWPQTHWPRRVPPGALGNHAALDLLPGQPVLIDSDQADAMFGDPFALVPARALDVWRGIAPVRPEQGLEVVELVFEADQVIYAEGGTLLFCPACHEITFDAEDGPVARLLAGAGAYAPLSLASARELVACLMAEDMGAALPSATPGRFHAALD